jgi:hypothetical protein
LLSIAFYLCAHVGHDLRHVAIDGGVIQARALQNRPKNTEVCIPVDRNTLNAGFNAQHCARRMLKGKVVDGVAAIEQGAIDIEEVSVCGVPAEPGTHKHSFAGGISIQV